MPAPENVRIAVLIDADNTSKSDAAALMGEVAKYGVPTVRRAYGDWTSNRLSGWKDQLNRHAIQPVQQFAYTTGKNSTDFALVIDAMDLLYSGNVDAFAIVSSDSDFTRLVTRLRESGKTVYGFGGRKTPQ
ncbi:MAG TPA: NYN domain-containing protein, partial [Nocardioides sp.]|nr:NYN domain-containing protein [Nocardioides sp.]